MNTVTMSAIIVTLFLGGPAGPHLFGPDWMWGPIWFLAKLLRLPVHVRVVPGHAAAVPLRPAHGPRVEGAHPAVARLAAAARRASTSPGTRTGTSASSSAIGFVVLVARLRAADGGHAHGRRLRRERARGGARLMGYLEGFRVTFGKLFKNTETGRTVTVPYVKDSGPKREKPERLHGRHVLNRYEDGMEKCIGCELCAGVCPARCIYVRGADNDARRPGVARRALRLRLRDQLPALHPLRPVRRGLPHRGHHRVEAVRVLLHQPRRRHLHEGRAASSTTTACPSSCRGRTGRDLATVAAHLGLGAGHRAVGRRRLRGQGRRGRASSASA